MKYFLLLILFCQSVFGATYYVDSKWTGTHSGTASQPWLSVDWTTLNTSLASADVTVYLTARLSGSDADAIYDSTGGNTPGAIDCSLRTDNSAHVLTIDGKSFYNTSEVTPSWSAYSGTSFAKLDRVVSQDCAHVKHSNITLHGLKIVNNTSSKEISIAGDNWIVEYCNCSHAAGATDGPGVLIVPTADAGHQGSSCYAPACTNIVIRFNVIHGTEGEAIYVGGGGDTPGTAGSGYPSHDLITIQGNTITNAGMPGDTGSNGEGDGIDVKGGITRLTITGNDISGGVPANQHRLITIQGLYNITVGTGARVIEKNILHDAAVSDGALALVDSWGSPQDTVVRNNIVYNITSTTFGAGIAQYASTTASPGLIYNNTTYACDGPGITAGSGFATLKNNLVLQCGGAQGGNRVNLGGSSITSDYNAYDGTLGYGSEGAHSVAVTTSAVVNAAAFNFYPATTSPLLNVGVTLTGFADDYAGIARPQGSAWEIGAYEYVVPTSTSSPGLPSGVRRRFSAIELLELKNLVRDFASNFSRVVSIDVQ